MSENDGAANSGDGLRPPMYLRYDTILGQEAGVPTASGHGFLTEEEDVYKPNGDW